MSFAVTATIAATATVASAYSANKSRKMQKKAGKAQEKQARLQSARDAMSQVRQARIAQSQIIQGASTQGTQSSSAAQGGYSAVGALTSGNMQFLNQMDYMNSQIGGLMSKSQNYAGQASMYNAAANLALQGSALASTPTTPAGNTGAGATSATRKIGIL
jgi:hypothetical protein